jgi:PmbA protein
METLKKEKRTIEEGASRLISEAFKAGADSAEVCGTYGHKTKISLEKQDYHLATSDDGYQFGLRVLKGQQQGFASSNSSDPKELKEVALRAVEIAAFSPANPYFSIQTSLRKPHPPKLTLFDPALSHISLQTQKDWIEWMRKEILKDPRIRLNEGNLEIGKGLYLVENSKGTRQIEASTHCVWSLMAMAADAEVLTSFDYFSQLSRKALGIGEKITETTRDFREGLIKNLKLGEASSYRGLVCFSPRAVLDILLDSLVYHLNGRVVLEGSGRWKLSDKNKKLISDKIHLIDTPWRDDLFGCSLFDREGTPTEEVLLISEGKLHSFLMDNYSAVGLHQRSTGHAGGGPSSLPTVGTHGLVLKGGSKSATELLQDGDPQGKGILLVKRYSGQTDPVTGDFSGVAKGSEWWVNGEFRYCVKETLISGNIFDCLNQGLVELSKQTQTVDASGESPMALIDGVSVTTG